MGGLTGDFITFCEGMTSFSIALKMRFLVFTHQNDVRLQGENPFDMGNTEYTDQR